jgi:two-component system NarL family sensor kinase
MWTLARYSRTRPSRAQLESLLAERAIALEKLTQRLLKLQDEERRRIARNLHDVTGQTLVALKMAVAQLEHNVQLDSCTSSVLREIDALVEQALQEIRTTSYLLHPPLLDEVGFTAAAEWYVEGFAKRSGIHTELDLVTEGERLPIAIETALFRVLQESLTNVHRYSGSAEVSINFQRKTEAVILEIADDGCGIRAEVLQRLSQGCAEIGVGLAGMRQRLRELNGSLEIISDRSGTRVRAIVPLFLQEQPGRCPEYWPGILPTTTYASSPAGRAA